MEVWMDLLSRFVWPLLLLPWLCGSTAQGLQRAIDGFWATSNPGRRCWSHPRGAMTSVRLSLRSPWCSSCGAMTAAMRTSSQVVVVARTLQLSWAREVYERRGEGATYVEGGSRAGSLNGHWDSQHAPATFGEVVGRETIDYTGPPDKGIKSEEEGTADAWGPQSSDSSVLRPPDHWSRTSV
jgi:hypothetical protein